MHGHRLAEERSLALHVAVAERIAADPSVLERARARVRSWEHTRAVHPKYARAWAEILERAPDEIRAAIVDEGERARALRQCSPFAGCLDARTRWEILRRLAARFAEAGRGAS